MMKTQQFGEHQLAEYVATCDNEECGNYDIPLVVWGDVDNPEVGCGACDKNSIPFQPSE